MGKKKVYLTYENERISIKNSLPYLKCVLRLSCVVHGPIYSRFMVFYVNGFLSLRKTSLTILQHPETGGWNFFFSYLGVVGERRFFIAVL